MDLSKATFYGMICKNVYKYVENVEKYEFSKKNRHHEKRFTMIKICVQCEKKFELTEKEMDIYRERGLEYPKYCPACRRANRMTNDAIVPKGKERRKNRKVALKAVPATFFTFLVILTFVYISFVRGGSGTGGTNPQGTEQRTQPNVQAAVLFRSEELLYEHYEKHGREMGFASAEEYLAGANATINNSTALHKTEKEDGDDVYYVESTNDFVVVSQDGYIRTYFRPEEGKEYYERQ